MSTPAAKPAPQTGAELLVKSLEAQGVEYVFGIPGAKIDKVFDTLLDSKIKTIVCRHEQNAAFMASGIGRMTEKAGVALVTSGPGCSNLVTGFATATSEGDPVVGIGGAVPVADRLKQLHQRIDTDLRPKVRQVRELQLKEESLMDSAQILDISLSAAKARLFHARAALRNSAGLRAIAPARAKSAA